MTLLDGVGGTRDRPATVRLSPSTVEELRARTTAQPNVLEVMPYEEDLDLVKAQQFLKTLHDVETGGLAGTKNQSDPFTIEFVYESESLRFRFGATTPRVLARIRRAARTHYPDADISEVPSRFLDLEPGQYLAGSWLTLRRDNYLLPIKHFQIDPEQFETDPYDSITSELVGMATEDDTTAMVQIVLRPAFSNHGWDRKNWHHGVDETAKGLKQPSQGFRWSSVVENLATGIVGGHSDEGATKTTPPTAEQKKAAETVANQRGEKGYDLNVRVLAVSDQRQEAIQRVEDTARMYRTFYTSTYEQGFDPVFPAGESLAELAHTAASREWTDRSITFSTSTLAGVAHLPTDITTHAVDWSQTSDTGTTPSSAPDFDSFREEVTEGE